MKDRDPKLKQTTGKKLTQRGKKRLCKKKTSRKKLLLIFLERERINPKIKVGCQKKQIIEHKKLLELKK